MLSSVKLVSEILSRSKQITNVAFQNNKVIKYLSTTTIEEKKIHVDGVDINYAKTGTGEHAVLLLPGVMGSIWTDFKPQIENLNKQKLTLITWDPPGYGKSRPPDRTFPINFLRRDATWAYNLMKTLGYDKFTLLGWSDGGNTSLVLAAMYPEYVQKMIVIAPHAYMTHAEIELYEKIRDIKTWSERMRAPMVAVYGEKYFQDTWGSWIDTLRFMFDNNNGDVCRGDLSKIQCPSLIVYGEKDSMVSKEHPDYLHANIKNSKVVKFKDGAHNLHLRYPNEFNALVHKFLLDQEDSKP